MIERGHPQVSLSRQCELLKLSRSSVYYVPREQCQEDLDLMYLIDQQHLETWLRRYNQAFQIGQASAGRSFRYSAIEILPNCGVSLHFRLSHGYSICRFSHSLPSPCFQASKSRSRQKRGLRPLRRSCSAVTGSRCRNGSSRGTSGRGCVTSM